MGRDSCLIAGTGALATFFAARLSAAGTNVTLMGSWRAALETFTKNGVQIVGEQAFFVNTDLSLNGILPAKHCIVLVKSNYTEKAAKQINSCIDENGCVLTLQNGLGNKEKLSSILGSERVFTGVTNIGERLISPGVVSASGKMTIWIEKHPDADNLMDIFQRSGFCIRVVHDILPYVWRKLIVNCAINPVTAIIRGKNGMLLTEPSLFYVVEKIIEESVSVSRVITQRNYFSNPVEMVKRVAEETSENMSSMLQDVLRGVPTEIDAINGEIIRLAKLHGQRVPVNTLIYSLIQEGKYLSPFELVQLSKSI